jgi:hypothetical protein
MTNCPWGGLPCDCTTFPYLKNGIVPIKCEEQMPDELLGLRKVSDAGKKRYAFYRGEMAGRDEKKSLKDNPYKPSDPLSNSWRDGFNAGASLRQMSP